MRRNRPCLLAPRGTTAVSQTLITGNAPPAQEKSLASEGANTLDDQVTPPGSLLQQRCNNLGYRRRGSIRELAAKIPERAKKARARMDSLPNPTSLDSSKCQRMPGALNDEPHEEKKPRNRFSWRIGTFSRRVPHYRRPRSRESGASRMRI